MRLGEHRESRQTLGLKSVPDFTTLYRFLKRLDDRTNDRAVGETVRRPAFVNIQKHPSLSTVYIAFVEGRVNRKACWNSPGALMEEPCVDGL